MMTRQRAFPQGNPGFDKAGSGKRVPLRRQTVKRTRSLFILVLVAILSFGGAMTPAISALAAGGTPTLGMVLTGGDGNQIQVAVQVSDVSNLGAFDLSLDVAGSALRIQSGILGSFLSSSGRQAYVLGPEVKFSGVTLSAGAYTTGDQAGASGTGTLLNANLAVQAEGISYLVLSRAILGTPDAQPIQAERLLAEAQVQNVSAGWNLISICPELNGQSVADALRTLQGRVGKVWGADGQPLSTLQGGSGAWLRLSDGASVRLVTLGSARRSTDPITLSAGWQLVAYCGDAAVDLTTALSSIQGKYDRVISLSGAYDAQVGAAYQTLSTLNPGDAILLHMTASGVLRFPETGTGNGSPLRSSQSGCPAVAATPTMTLLYGDVMQNGSPAPAGTLVEVLDANDQVVGCATVGQDGHFGLMAAYGQDAEAGIPGYQTGQSIRLRVGSCVQEVGLTWQDDREPHRVDMALDGAGNCQVSNGGYRIFLPLIMLGQ